MWRNELRVNRFKISINETQAYLDSVNSDKFIKTIMFLKDLFNDDRAQYKNREFYSNIQKELNVYDTKIIK